MESCSNCGAELAPGEVELCYPCSNATPQERERRRARGTPVAQPQRPPRVNVLYPRPATSDARIHITTQSGERFTISKLVLFPEPEVREHFRLKAKAQEELSGFSSGIGLWGSPEWVLGGGLALGLVESMVSNAKFKKGLETMAEASAQQVRVRTRGVLFGVHEIEGVWQPDPAKWLAAGPGDRPDDGPVTFIHGGDEFIWFDSEGAISAARWSAIDSYRMA